MARTVLALVLLAALAGCRATPGPDLSEYLRRGRMARAEPVAWRLVRHFDFEDPGAMEAFVVGAGEWEIAGGALWAVGGERNRGILLARFDHDPVRVDFTATCHARPDGRLGDITTMLRTAPGERFGKDVFGGGYTATTASYWNQCTTLYRLGVPFARTEHSPVRDGVPNRVRVELRGGHLRLWLNGAILLEAWDPAPLPPGADRWLGIRTWGTRMAVDDVTVYAGEVLEGE